MTNRAELLLDNGELEAADACLEEAEKIYARRRDQQGLTYVEWLRGVLALRRGDPCTARTLLVRALDGFRNMGELEYSLATLETLAGADMYSGEAAEAACLMGAVNGMRRAVGLARQPRHQGAWEACVAAARTSLGESDFEAAWHEGTTWHFERAVERAIEGAQGAAASEAPNLVDRTQQIACPPTPNRPGPARGGIVEPRA